MSNAPKVSVCVVTYNQEKYVRQSLQSIVEQKTDFDFEVIVGDDCSTDNTRSIVQEMADRYPSLVKPIFHTNNTGPSQNYLTVHEAATGMFVAHMDGDDYWLPNKLQTQVDFMEMNPRANVSGHKMDLIDGAGLVSKRAVKNFPVLSQIDSFYDHGNYLAHSSTMYRRTCSIARRLEGHPAFDFMIHVLRVNTGQIGFINEYLGAYRRHPLSIISRNVDSLILFHWNIAVMENINSIVKEAERFENAKTKICVDFIRHYLVNGRLDLARRVTVDAERMLLRKKHLLHIYMKFALYLRWYLKALVTSK